MTTLITKSIVVTLITIFGFSMSYAENPAYKINLTNVNFISSNALEFDIYLQHTNPDKESFKYFFGQYFIDFNSEFANGGSLTYTLISSDLPGGLQPGNPSVSGNVLRLATNSVPADTDIPVISYKEPGTLIARMRLETSGNSFSKAKLNLKLRTGPENPFTKIAAYVEDKVVDVTNYNEVMASDEFESDGNNSIPKVFALQQNYPNPFNPVTNISYDLPSSTHVTLKIFDMTGREVAELVNKNQNAGSYSVQFNGSNFASGIYFYRIKADNNVNGSTTNFVFTKKMVMIK